MRKFKAIVRYQMADILFSMSVFFIVFAACFGLGWAIIAFAGEGEHAVQGHVPVDVRVLWVVLRRHIVFHRLQVRAAMRRDPRPGVSEHRAVVRRGGAASSPWSTSCFWRCCPCGASSRWSRCTARATGRGFSASLWTLAFNLAIVFLSYALVVVARTRGEGSVLAGASGVRPPGVRAGAHRLPGGAGRGRRCGGGASPCARVHGSRDRSWRTPSRCSPSSPRCRRAPTC